MSHGERSTPPPISSATAPLLRSWASVRTAHSTGRLRSIERESISFTGTPARSIRNRPGEPTEAIANAAATLQADLVVVGVTDGAAPDGELGPVAAGVLREAHCDVLVVR
jgi:nucleotide-binding universal stress UspA family protein